MNVLEVEERRRKSADMLTVYVESDDELMTPIKMSIAVTTPSAARGLAGEDPSSMEEQQEEGWSAGRKRCWVCVVPQDFSFWAWAGVLCDVSGFCSGVCVFVLGAPGFGSTALLFDSVSVTNQNFSDCGRTAANQNKRSGTQHSILPSANQSNHTLYHALLGAWYSSSVG